MTDSVYCAELNGPCILHVTKDGRVIVSDFNVIVVMDTDGTHLIRYEEDKNQELFSEKTSITSTINGNMFVADYNGSKVVVFKNTDIINRGHSTVYDEATQPILISYHTNGQCYCGRLLHSYTTYTGQPWSSSYHFQYQRHRNTISFSTSHHYRRTSHCVIYDKLEI